MTTRGSVSRIDGSSWGEKSRFAGHMTSDTWPRVHVSCLQVCLSSVCVWLFLCCPGASLFSHVWCGHQFRAWDWESEEKSTVLAWESTCKMQEGVIYRACMRMAFGSRHSYFHFSKAFLFWNYHWGVRCFLPTQIPTDLWRTELSRRSHWSCRWWRSKCLTGPKT